MVFHRPDFGILLPLWWIHRCALVVDVSPSISCRYHAWVFKCEYTRKNPSNNPLKLKVIEPENAVCNLKSWGPVFGRHQNMGRDLSFYSFEDSDNCMNFKSYESPNGKQGVKGVNVSLEVLQINMGLLKSKCSKIFKILFD